jgi:hypothetical protein
LNAQINRLYERYRSHHDMNRTVLEWVGAVGVLAFPLFYLIRLATDLPSRYDDLGLRLVATFLCLLVALRKWWPEKAERFYLAFSYLTICYSLSFLLTFTMLHNGGATNSVVNMVIGTALIILLADWRNALIMLASGYLLSFGIYLTTSPDPVIPMEILYWWMPLCALIVVVGALSKFGDKQAELERIHKLYAGLAGSIAHEMRNPIMHLAHTLEVVAASTPPIGGADSVSLTRRQVLAITGAISEGNSSIARGLQSILITLQQLKPDPFDEKSFRYLSAARCVEKAVNEYAYRIGTRINIDVLNAEQQLHASQRDLFKARVDALMQGLRLKAAAGSLMESDIDGLNVLLDHSGKPGDP